LPQIGFDPCLSTLLSIIVYLFLFLEDKNDIFKNCCEEELIRFLPTLLGRHFHFSPSWNLLLIANRLLKPWTINNSLCPFSNREQPPEKYPGIPFQRENGWKEI